MHACNPSNGVEAGGLEVQGNLQLREEFKASLGYMREGIEGGGEGYQGKMPAEREALF